MKTDENAKVDRRSEGFRVATKDSAFFGKVISKYGDTKDSRKMISVAGAKAKDTSEAWAVPYVTDIAFSETAL